MSKIVQLGEIAAIYSGGTPSRAHSSYWGGNIPWVKTAQIQNTFIQKEDITEWITDKGLAKSSAKLVSKGTILMAMYGQGKTRGRVSILEIDASVNQACCVIELRKEADKRFIYQQLIFDYEAIRSISNSGGQKNLSVGLIKKLHVFLPPLPQQKAIASFLEKWDTAIEKNETLIVAKEKQFKWLLKRLINDQMDNPAWQKVKLGNILNYEQPTKYIVKSTNYTDKGLVAVLTANKSFILGHTKEHEGVFNKHPVIIFDDFTTANKYVDFQFKVKSSAIKILKLINTNVNLKFIHHSMKFIDFPLGGHQRYWISEYQYLEIKLPPLIEQKYIISILDIAQKEIDLLKQLTEQYRIQKRGLMQKLLTGQ